MKRLSYYLLLFSVGFSSNLSILARFLHDDALVNSFKRNLH